MKAPKVYRFWTRALNTSMVSRYRLFVAKSDYDKLMREYKALKSQKGVA